ncbi:MAG: peptidase S8, partial [Cyanobacteria bacterium P01_C01_bin.38]
MHANFSDSNLFSEKHNITSIASIDELNVNLKPNNFSLLSSSFESSTDSSFVNTAQLSESSITSNITDSDITVTDSEIQFSTQNNFYASNTQDYSSSSGYGLTNAAEAVAEVAGEETFDDVPDTGGNN